MQAEIDTTTKARPVQILGVNQVGLESDNALICEGRVLPWLQDTPAVNVWGAWRVEWRDVVILNADNQVIRTYNLTSHDLAAPANYAELKGILIAAAR